MKTRSILPAAVAAFLVATTTDTLAYERGDVILHLSFDDTVDAVGAASGSTVIHNGNTPAYSSDTPAPTIYWTRDGGGTMSQENLKSLSAVTNMIQLKFPDLGDALHRPNLPSATIEFFYRCSSASLNTTPVRFTPNPRVLTTPPFPFLLQSHYQTGRVFIRLDSFSDVNAAGLNSADREAKSATMSNLIDDDVWHHLAVTIAETAGGYSEIKFYFDHALVSTATTSTFAWNGLTENMTIDFGGGGLSCCIDEFRISKGVLTPGEFLQVNPMPEDGEAIVHLSFDDTVDAVGAASGSTICSGTPAYTNDMPSQTIYWMPDGGNVQSRANAKSLAVLGNLVKLQFPKTPALQKPLLKNATIEFFVKGLSGSEWAVPLKFGANNNVPFPFMLQVNNSGNYYLRVDCFETSDVWDALSQSLSTPFADETWHHVAATVSETTNGLSTVKYFFDYAPVGTATSTRFAWTGISDNMTLDIGRGGRFLIDEFRISKGVLPRTAFLRTSRPPQDGDAIVHLSFDETVDSLGSATGSTTIYSGTPVYADALPAREVGSMLGDGKRTWRPNLKSLYVNSNMIQLKLPKILMADLERPNLRNATIECFVKGVAAEKNDSAVRFTPYQNALQTPPFPFFMSSNWQTEKLSVRLDAFDEGLTDFNQNAFSFAPDFTEGKWHHIAVTIAETQDGKSLFNFYLDGRLASTKTSEQYQWDGLTDSMSIDFGANKNNDSLKCYIDEFRISKGVLTPEAFLQKGPVATVLSFR